MKLIRKKVHICEALQLIWRVSFTRRQLRLKELLYQDTNGTWFNAQHPDDSFGTTHYVTKALAPRFEVS